MARVLVADDNAALLANVGQSLRDAGHLVTSTNNGADAICLLETKPDLLLLDLRMPGTDGLTVLHSLPDPPPPVIVMTGTGIDAVELLGGKVRRVLAKPFGEKELLAAVRDALTSEVCP